MRLAAVVLLAAFPLFAQQKGAVHGVVKDASTGQPLADFSVTASRGPKVPPNAIVTTNHIGRVTAPGYFEIDPDKDMRVIIDPQTGKRSQFEVPREETADTGSDGKYRLTNVAAGTVTITARNGRRETVTREVTLNPGDDLAVDLLIPPNPMVSGRVLDSGKKPLAGAEVWVVQSTKTAGTAHYSLMGPRVTDNNGSYAFDFGLTAGRTFYVLADRPRPLKIDLEEPIEAPTYYGNVIELEAATPIVLERGENRRSIDIRIRKSEHYCVEGTLAVSGNLAKNRFEIHQVALAETSLVRAAASSGDDGKYRVCGLTPGQYRISAKAPGGAADVEDFAIANSDVTHLDLMLDAASLHLTAEWDRMQEDSGDPGLTVLLKGETNHEARTADVHLPYDGLFDSSLPAGDYRLTVTPVACCYVKQVEYNGVRLSGPLHLGAGSSGTLRVVLASDGATLKCKAVDDDGKPVEGAAFVLVPDAPDGEPLVNWQMLAPGKYKVLAVNRAVILADDAEKINRALSYAQSIELAPNDKIELRLKSVSIDDR